MASITHSLPNKALPHEPYANAVMDALDAEGLINLDESWTEYASDNGEVMMMETAITLDEDRARAAGWTHGLLLTWNHTYAGWEWGPQRDGGARDYVLDLVTGTAVPDPADVIRAVKILLDDAPVADRLPITGTTRPPAQTITPILQAVLARGGVDEETARRLSAYSTTAPEKEESVSERVNVKILLLIGDQAEVVADVPDPDVPARYPAGEIAAAVGADLPTLPGMRLSALVGADGQLSEWRRL